MEARTNQERRLKADIIRKNILRKDLEQCMSAIDRWETGLQQTRSKQKQQKRRTSIARYEQKAEPLKKKIVEMGADIEKRIKKEMAVSEDEIKAFEDKLKKELKEFNTLQKKLEETEKKKPKPETLNLRRTLERRLKEEFKAIEKDKAELKSEERDKILFTQELKRIALERQLYGA